LSFRIKDTKIKSPRMTFYPRDIRFIAVDGDGTYSMNQQKLLPKIGKETGSNNYTCYTLGTDNNYKAVGNAIGEIKPCVDWKPHFWWKNHYRAIMKHLPSLDDTVGGFGRSPKTCIESAPRFKTTIMNGVSNAKFHDLKCGAKTSFRIEPFNWGSHLPVKMLQDLESRIQGLLRGTRIGLTTIPTEIMALRVFHEWFPMLLSNGMFGVDATVISDEKLGSFSRNKRETDEMILKGIIGTCMSSMSDSSVPGYRDIWALLSGESKLVGVNAVENDIIAWRRLRTLWRVGIDMEVSVIQIRRLIQQVLSDPNTRLIDAEVQMNSPKVLVVVARVHKHIFDQAVEEAFVPNNVIPLFVPTKSFKITAVLFYPLCGRIFSIEERFGLKKYIPENPYCLPEAITLKSIQCAESVVEKAATVANVSPDFLINGRRT
jgi:hypothetical protein